MKKSEPLENQDLKRLELFLLLTPIAGFFPALWTLYRRKGSPSEQATSRLAVTLALMWVLGTLLLQAGAGSNPGEFGNLPLLLTTSLFSTSYFIVSFALMVRVWKRQPLWLPGVSQIAEKVLGKHLN